MSRQKKRIPVFDHTYCVQGLNIATLQKSIMYRKRESAGVKQFVLILSYRPLHTFSRTLSCSMDAKLVVDRR